MIVNIYITLGKVWWCTSTELSAVAPWRRLLQNTLYLLTGKSEAGAFHLSSPVKLPSGVISNGLTLKFPGAAGGLGPKDVINSTLGAEYPLLPCLLTAATLNWYHLPGLARFRNLADVRSVRSAIDQRPSRRSENTLPAWCRSSTMYKTGPSSWESNCSPCQRIWSVLPFRRSHTDTSLGVRGKPTTINY